MPIYLLTVISPVHPNFINRFFFTVVGASDEQHDPRHVHSLRNENFNPFDIPHGSTIVIQKLIEGKPASNDVVTGTLERITGDLPSLENSLFGTAVVLVGNVHVFIGRLEAGFRYEDHEINYGSATYRCLIHRRLDFALGALLVHQTRESHLREGSSRILFVNHRNIHFEGELKLANFDFP